MCTSKVIKFTYLHWSKLIKIMVSKTVDKNASSKLKLYNYFYITYYKKEELIFDSLPWQKGEPVRSLAFWIAKTSHPVVNNARGKMHPPTIGWNHWWRTYIHQNKIIERVRNICSISTFLPFLLAFKGQKIKLRLKLHLLSIWD